MFRKNSLIILFIFSIFIFTPLWVQGALTEEGIYRIDWPEYFIENNEVSADKFLSSLIQDIQCDASGVKKVIIIDVSMPIDSEDGSKIAGRTLNGKWKVTMPASMTIQQAPNDPRLPAKVYGNSISCNPY